MGEALGHTVALLIAVVVAVFLWEAIGMSDALNEADKGPAPATREQLESLCIAGNANACKLYQVRYEERCIL